ncbi:hypothetical protein FQA39_LY13152 [Lamprigera yunnana]|nr:hypothetical protein FQA39_LY13152 [Lamprigera yunnana]
MNVIEKEFSEVLDRCNKKCQKHRSLDTTMMMPETNNSQAATLLPPSDNVNILSNMSSTSKNVTDVSSANARPSTLTAVVSPEANNSQAATPLPASDNVNILSNMSITNKNVKKKNRLEPIENLPSTSSLSLNVTPESVRPFPKAQPQTQSVKGRKKKYSRILTDTPEKDKLKQEYFENQMKKEKKEQILECKKEVAKRKITDKFSGKHIKKSKEKPDCTKITHVYLTICRQDNEYDEEFEDTEEQLTNALSKVGSHVLKFATKEL